MIRTYPRCWLAACILFAATSATAGSTLGSTVARAAIDFRITIPTVVKAEARADPASLRVTAEDVKRGYVDLDDASSVVLTSNSHQGFMLEVAFDPAMVSALEVRVAGRTVRAAESGSAIVVQSGPLVGKRIRVSYRLYLASHAEAGEHRWPVAVNYFAASV